MRNRSSSSNWDSLPAGVDDVVVVAFVWVVVDGDGVADILFGVWNGYTGLLTAAAAADV